MPATPPWSPALQQPVPLWRQILDHFASRIESGELAPGDALPTTLELARSFQVTVNTVQQGLDGLRRRGLVERLPGRGTFVSAKARARTLGVAFGSTVLTDSDNRFYLLLWGHLGRLAKRRGWDLRVYLPIDGGDLPRVAEEIRQDAATGRLRALFYLTEMAPLSRALDALTTLPVARMDQRLDFAQLVRMAVARLALGGARRLMLLSPHQLYAETCQTAFHEALQVAGLPPVTSDALKIANNEQHGLEVGRALAAMPAAARPDGVVVVNDNACRGLFAALLAAGLRIPGDLRVVSHANRGLAVFPGIEVTRVEFDPAEVAEAMLTSLLHRLASQPAEPATIAPVLVPGTTCGCPA